MANIYGGIDLIGGGTGAIDKINGSVLNDKDIFVTIKDGIFYPHWLDDDSGAAENSPLVISPDLNAGNKRWLLADGVFAGLISYGNVGIGLGALTPSKLLTVAAVDGTHTEVLLKSTNLAGVYLDLDAGAVNRPAVIRHYLNGTLKWAAGILYLEAGNEKYSIGTSDLFADAKITIHSDGKVSIGTSDASTGLLTIEMDSSSARHLVLREATDPNFELYMGWDSDGDYGAIQAFLQGTGARNLVLQQAGGNIGIGAGAISPGARLDLAGTMLFSGASSGLPFGEISVVSNATETAIATQNVYVQITTFDTNGESLNVTPDHTNDHLTITKAGRYFISCSITLNSVGGAGSIAEMEVKKNNGASRVGSLHADRTLAGGGAESGAIPMTGIVNLSVDDTIEVWIKNETNTQNYVVEDITLTLSQKGG